MSRQGEPITVFYSYAHADEDLLCQLETHLSLLRRQGLVITWHRRDITPGTDWATALDAHLGTASLILLLISPDFIASDYCYGVELQRAMARHDANEAQVIPILLRPVADWDTAAFARLAVLPTNRKPITMWLNRDEAWTEVARGIRRAIERLLTTAGSSHRSSMHPIEGERPAGFVLRPRLAPLVTTWQPRHILGAVALVLLLLVVVVISLSLPTLLSRPQAQPSPQVNPSCISSTPSAASSGNLLTNGSFEQGKGAPGWAWGGTGTNVQVYQTSEAKDGEWWMQTNTQQADASIYQDVQFVPHVGRCYTASIWVRAQSTAITGSLVLWALGTTTEHSSTNFTATSSDWTLVTVSLTVTPLGHTLIRFQVYSNTHGDNLNLDGAVLVEGVGKMADKRSS